MRGVHVYDDVLRIGGVVEGLRAAYRRLAGSRIPGSRRRSAVRLATAPSQALVQMREKFHEFTNCSGASSRPCCSP
jgi:hypothetical protein